MTEIVIEVRWFSGRDLVGAVLVDVNGEQVAYIGVGAGYNQEADIQSIRRYGCRLSLPIAASIFPVLNPKKYSVHSI